MQCRLLHPLHLQQRWAGLLLNVPTYRVLYSSQEQFGNQHSVFYRNTFHFRFQCTQSGVWNLEFIAPQVGRAL